jgi:CheY-like chemotaxis protein
MPSALLILVVDERQGDACWREWLREAGYCVVHAEGGAAALSLLDRDAPDLIIALDRAGRDFVRSLEVRNGSLECPLIMIGDSRPTSRFPTKFLPKTITKTQLMQEIRSVVRAPAQRPETD